MKAMIRVDASTGIGSGHVMRCITLANALEKSGWQCQFASKRSSVDTVSALAKSGFDIVDMPNEVGDQPDALREAVPDGVNLLIVDSYDLDSAFEKECRSWTESILVIDDLANRAHDADILLDQTYGRGLTDYEAWVSPGCKKLVGSHYALLRPEFSVTRPAALARRDAHSGPADRILVCLGSNDPDNVTSTVLKGIYLAGAETAVDVVLGRGAPYFEDVRKNVHALPRARLFSDVDDMVSLMMKADLAIGAGGMMTWERCCLGLPTLTITIAENQVANNGNLDSDGAVIHLGWHASLNSAAIATAIQEVQNNSERLRELSESTRIVCDGRGQSRVLIALIGSEFTSLGDMINLRLLEVVDEETLFGWQRDSRTRRFFREPISPDKDTHKNWMAHNTHGTGIRAAVIQRNEEPIGLLQFKSIGREEKEISMLIDPEFWGRGIGTTALHLAKKLNPGLPFWAEIHSDNVASLRAFEKAGFTSTRYEGWYRTL